MRQRKEETQNPTYWLKEEKQKYKAEITETGTQGEPGKVSSRRLHPTAHQTISVFIRRTPDFPLELKPLSARAGASCPGASAAVVAGGCGVHLASEKPSGGSKNIHGHKWKNSILIPSINSIHPTIHNSVVPVAKRRNNKSLDLLLL